MVTPVASQPWMRRLLALLAASLLVLGAASCGDDDDSEPTSDDTSDVSDDEEVDEGEPADEGDEEQELDQGSDEAVAAINQLVAQGVEEDYGPGPVEVDCPTEITEAEGVYECDVYFADDTVAVATVSTEGGNIQLVSVE